MKAFIHSYSSISRIASYEDGIFASLAVCDEVQHPNYKDFIPMALVRRMSGMIRMGVGAALLAKGERTIDGIIVGTGLGCLENTVKFLDQLQERQDGGMLAPTAFIQSTHNTVAGQLGMMLQNNGYNCTHTQGGHSFETALIDAMLLANENNGSILVGGVDEKIALLNELATHTALDISQLSEGSSFFVVSGSSTGAAAQISACSLRSLDATNKITAALDQFLQDHDLPIPDCIVFGRSFPSGQIISAYQDAQIMYYDQYSGMHMTNVAFGVQMGTEVIQGKAPVMASNVLVINNYQDRSLGIVYLQRP